MSAATTRRGACTLLLWLVLIGCDDGGGGSPHIDQLAPAQAAAGDTVNVLGENFCGVVGAAPDGSCADTVSGFVTFGVAPGIARAQVSSWKDTRVDMIVPAVTAGQTTVALTVDGVQSNAVDFEATP